jgi:hypothetical protein
MGTNQWLLHLLYAQMGVFERGLLEQFFLNLLRSQMKEHMHMYQMVSTLLRKETWEG